MSVKKTPEVILLSPLFGQRLTMTPEERQAARKLVFENRRDPAVKALFNLLERTTFRMQSEGVAAGATPHDQGQACGALHVYGLARTWLEQPLKQDEAGG